jgi:hypothetical protein
VHPEICHHPKSRVCARLQFRSGQRQPIVRAGTVSDLALRAFRGLHRPCLGFCQEFLTDPLTDSLSLANVKNEKQQAPVSGLIPNAG